MNPLWILLLILILSYLAYYLINKYLLPTPPTQIGATTMNLSEQTTVLTGAVLAPYVEYTSGTTLIFLINPVISDRTTYGNNEYVTAMQLGSLANFNILTAPDAGRDSAYTPATIDINVNNGKNRIKETIELSYFPLQRWSSVAIVIEGSRFNIYINGQISASHTCINGMPYFDKTTSLIVGNSRLRGQVANMNIVGYAMKPNDILSQYTNSVNNEGTPSISSGLAFLIPTFPNITIKAYCPGGNCISPIKPYESWRTSFNNS